MQINLMCNLNYSANAFPLQLKMGLKLNAQLLHSRLGITRQNFFLKPAPVPLSSTLSSHLK